MHAVMITHGQFLSCDLIHNCTDWAAYDFNIADTTLGVGYIERVRLQLQDGVDLIW